MKKISIWELLVISVGVIALCFSISKFVLCKFNMASDFLTASATFIAAIVAISLFNDWKDQYRTELFERLKDRIHHLFDSLSIQYDAMYKSILINKNKDATTITDDIIKFSSLLENLAIELDFYERLIAKFHLDNIKLNVSPASLRFRVRNYEKGLTFEDNDEVETDEDIAKHVYNYMKNNSANQLIISYKSEVNADLQGIILTLIGEQKGQ